MEDELVKRIVDAAEEVHQYLGGPGLIENVYEVALCQELLLRGMMNERQIPIPVMYKSMPVREPLFLDILVEGQVVVEVKAVGKEIPYYRAQLATHLRLTGKRRGLLINFGKDRLRDGVCEVVNDCCPLAG
jgi:GxxExxY protein